MRPWLGTVFALAVALVLATSAVGVEVDSETGLIVDENFQLVKSHCTACHSAKLVTQMRANREGWESLIRWMQKTQNLWPFPPATEASLLDYLSEHYAPDRTRFRREPLDAALLPPSP